MNEHTKLKKPATYSVAEAKARFSELLKKAARGEEILVTKHGKPYVKLSPDVPPREARARVGAFEGQFELPDDWDSIPTGFEPYR